MSERSTDPFEAAAEGAGEKWLNGEAGAAGAAPSPLSSDEPIELPAEPKPSRLRNRSGTRRRGRPPKAPSGGEVAGEPGAKATAPAAPKVPPLKPEAIAPLIKQLDQALVKFLQTEPLSASEVNDGAVAFAPLLDHYMPQLIESEKGKLWIAPTVWVLTAYGPRAIVKLEEATERKKVQRAFKPVSHASEDAPQGASFSDAAEATGARGDGAPPIGTGL